MIYIRIYLCLFLLSFAACATNPWAKFKVPTHGKPASIGSYSAGCIAGAAELESPQGPGYLLMRPSRGRHFGHPNLVNFLRQFASGYYKKNNRLLLFGDLGQPRGGPMPKAHKSHQTGLDADIWLTTLPDDGHGLSVHEREAMDAPLVADYEKDSLNKKYWSEQTAELLKSIATRPEVDRVFVNPVIKRELCFQNLNAGRGKKKDNRAWLIKIRPWWGHDRHFHIRLGCPVGDSSCIPQTAVSGEVKSIDGCDETLNWWFSEEAKLEARKMDEAKPDDELPKLPDACEGVAEAI